MHNYQFESLRLPLVVLVLQNLAFLHRAPLGLQPGAKAVESLVKVLGPRLLGKSIFWVQIEFPAKTEEKLLSALTLK